VRLRLTPRTTEFYDLFARAGENALEAARHAEIRFREFPNASVTQADVKAIETSGDQITHDLINLLNTQYVTPFDREDIYELATAVDDVVDYIDEATQLLDLYSVEAPTLSRLKSMRGVQEAIVELKRLEDEADRVVHDAIAALFRDDRIDPLIVIRWKDIYDSLEEAIDACEHAANVIGNILVKNA
jgi:uncharacterized protein Yka (UPF0111/DUF47 family)